MHASAQQVCIVYNVYIASSGFMRSSDSPLWVALSCRVEKLSLLAPTLMYLYIYKHILDLVLRVFYRTAEHQIVSVLFFFSFSFPGPRQARCLKCRCRHWEKGLLGIWQLNPSWNITAKRLETLGAVKELQHKIPIWRFHMILMFLISLNGP